jgi:hypothetical protein
MVSRLSSDTARPRQVEVQSASMAETDEENQHD